MLEATALTVILMSAMHQMRAISANMLTRVPTFRFCNGQVLVQPAVFQAATKHRGRDPQAADWHYTLQVTNPVLLPGDIHIDIKKERRMKLVYDVIEDAYDDTTQIRTMTEQAKLPSGEWLVRTTIYTPHHISMDVTHIRGKKNRKSLFKALR